jgi:hypothetical protein
LIFARNRGRGTPASASKRCIWPLFSTPSHETCYNYFLLLIYSLRPTKSVLNICLLLFSLRKVTQSKSNYLLNKNEILVMPNLLSLTCTFYNSVLYPARFFFAKLPEAYAYFNPIVDVMPIIPLFFSISLCLASCFKFPMKCLVLYLPNWMLYSFQKINKMCTRRELLYFYITSMYARQTIKDSVW